MAKTKNVMLTVTEKCNLNCIYCFEKNKSAKSMTFETAKRIIDYEMAENNEYDSILFDFMGGEPFVEFALIKQICEYVWSKQWTKKYMFFASTNGTLIHGEIQEWLSAHYKEFVCGLSLDGTREQHNLNRCNSFDAIDIDFFATTWSLQSVKMTVSPESLPDLYNGIRFIHALGFRVKSNLAYGPDWSGEINKQVFEQQLKQLIEYYVENPEVEPTTLVNMDLIPVAYPKEKLHKWCGMGGQMVAYDIYGNKYPCHFFQEMTSGVDECKDVWSIDYSKIHCNANKKCKECILKNSCPTCYGYNYSQFHDYCHKDDYICELKKRSAVATATLTYRRLALKYNNNFSNLSNEEKEKIKAIFMIQRAAESGNWNIC